MRTKNLQYGSSVFAFVGVVLVLSIVLCAPKKATADESRGHLARTVNIQIHDGMIEPGDIDVPAGTTVVWLNHAGSPVKVRFTKPSLGITCKAPLGFREGHGGIMTSSLGSGQAASVCLLEPDKYTYEVDGIESSEGIDSVTPQGAPLTGVVTVNNAFPLRSALKKKRKCTDILY